MSFDHAPAAPRFGAARAVAKRHAAAIGQTFFVYDARVGIAGLCILAIAAPHLAISGLVVSALARVVAERAGAARTLLDSGLLELNGFFLGLACGTFFAIGPSLAVALLLGGPLIAALTIVMHRVLATWDVPLLVGPYVPAFWILWCGLSALSWIKPAVLPAAPAPSSAWLLVLLGGLRGVGQIFFLPNAAVGVAIAIAATIGDRRMGIAMLGSSIATVGVGYLAGSPSWQVEQGLAGFTAALVAAAALRGFVGLGRVAVVIAVIASPLLESAALRLAAPLGVHALSATYVVFVWTFALLRPVRDVSSARAGWSMGSKPKPRLFEDGA